MHVNSVITITKNKDFYKIDKTINIASSTDSFSSYAHLLFLVGRFI